MASKNDNYVEGCSMQRPPLLEADGFCYWKQRFETYVCAKDIELWDRIESGDYVPENWLLDKKILPERKDWTHDQKVGVAKNHEAKLMLYNALPRSEYERVFMCKSAKEAWDTLVVTHQGNSQVIENKIELLVAQYESFSLVDNEKIDVGYTRFNNICTSLKALGTSYTPKQYMRKFLRALPSKWRPKVTAIDEAQDFDKLTMDELIGNLKVYEVVLEKDEEIEKLKKEKFKSIALKAKSVNLHEDEEDNEEACENEDDDLAMMVRSFKKIFRRRGNFVRPPMNDTKRDSNDFKKKIVRRCFNCGDPNHMVHECPKKKNERAYVGGAWEDEEDDQDVPQEKCMMAIKGDWSDSEEEENTFCLTCISDNEVHSESILSYDKLECDYEKLVNLSAKISDKNKCLKLEIKSLKNEVEKQKELIANLMKGKAKACLTCDDFKQENGELLNKITRLEKELHNSKSEKSGEVLNDILRSQKSPFDKSGLGFSHKNSLPSTSKAKPIVFVKQQEKPYVEPKPLDRTSKPFVRPSPLNHQVNLYKGQSNLSKVPNRVEKPHIVKNYYTQIAKHGIGFSNNQNNSRIQNRPFQHQSRNTLNGNRHYNLARNGYNNFARNGHNNMNRISYNHRMCYCQRYTRNYPRNIRIVKRWVKVGMFDANNPGPMKHWVPSS